ncbi:MAG TPA: DUF2721 domain-containing protein [Stellaceae bacterium]|nr:DUF2721 domain-containing protein [Stellaceae bacterium]
MPIGPDAVAVALGSVVHIIQIALTPVFLLSGVATLLNVFSTRLGRVADQVDATSKLLENADATTAAVLASRLATLHRRSVALDIAVVLGAAAGALTCATVLALFIGEAGGPAVAAMLYAGFGLAIACTLVSIGAFAWEMMVASKWVRAEVVAGRQRAEPE